MSSCCSYDHHPVDLAGRVGVEPDEVDFSLARQQRLYQHRADALVVAIVRDPHVVLPVPELLILIHLHDDQHPVYVHDGDGEVGAEILSLRSQPTRNTLELVVHERDILLQQHHLHLALGLRTAGARLTFRRTPRTSNSILCDPIT